MRVGLQLFENDVGSDSPVGGLRWAVGPLGCARRLWRNGAIQWQRLRSENTACGESKEKTLTRLPGCIHPPPKIEHKGDQKSKNHVVEF